MTKEVSPSGAETASSYDAFGNLVSVVNPTGSVTRFEYTDNLPVRAVDVRGGEWRWSYDRAGRMTERRLPSGEAVRFEYERGLLVRIIVSAARAGVAPRGCPASS